MPFTAAANVRSRGNRLATSTFIRSRRHGANRQDKPHEGTSVLFPPRTADHGAENLGTDRRSPTTSDDRKFFPQLLLYREYVRRHQTRGAVFLIRSRPNEFLERSRARPSRLNVKPGRIKLLSRR
jgi:hypothetical protein